MLTAGVDLGAVAIHKLLVNLSQVLLQERQIWNSPQKNGKGNNSALVVV